MYGSLPRQFVTTTSRSRVETGRRRRTIRLVFDRLETRELLSAGYFDKTFGTKGKMEYTFGGTTGLNPQAEAVAVLPNGKMIVAGPIKTGGAYFVGNRRLVNKTGDIGVVRLNANGTVDKTFGDRGEAVVSFNAGENDTDSVAAISIDDVGRIVIAGTGTRTTGKQEIVVLRLNANGSYDKSFGIGGRSYANFDSLGFTSVDAAGMVTDPQGRIVVAGTLFQPNGQNEFGVIRLETNGQFDQSFGDQGRAYQLVAIPDVNNDIVSGVTLDNQGASSSRVRCSEMVWRYSARRVCRATGRSTQRSAIGA